MTVIIYSLGGKAAKASDCFSFLNVKLSIISTSPKIVWDIWVEDGSEK